MELGVFSPSLILETRNAQGAYNIPALYQEALADYYFDAIYAMFDVDNPKHFAYEAVVSGLTAILGDGCGRYEVRTNPCTMQLMLLHMGPYLIHTSDKTALTPLIRKCWPGIKDVYGAHVYQLDAIVSSLTRENYRAMKGRLRLLGEEPLECPSTNFGLFLRLLEGKEKGSLPLSGWKGPAIGRVGEASAKKPTQRIDPKRDEA
jgi:hypothetical protein